MVLIPLGFVIFYVVREGHRRRSAASWFTKDIPAVEHASPVGGMGPAIVGTLLITVGAAVMAVPLGVLGAIYLHEYGGTRPARPPHPVHGRRHDRRAVDRDGPVHLHDLHAALRPRRASAAALALACLMLPIVIRSTEEMLRLVPDELRNGSYALGNRKWRTILTVVLPAALGGIVSGVMLAVARAAGETAPLLFTIGACPQPQPRTCSRARTPRCRCRSSATPSSRSPAAQDRAWGAALTLVVIVFLFTVARPRRLARFSLKHALRSDRPCSTATDPATAPRTTAVRSVPDRSTRPRGNRRR